MSAPRVKLVTLSIRESSRGGTYYLGWLGHAKVLGFPGREPDRFGNETIDLFLVEPEQRDGAADTASSPPGEPADRRPARPASSTTGQRRSQPPAHSSTAAGDDGVPFDDQIPF